MRPSRQGAGRSGAAAPGAVALVVASALTLGACTAWVGPTRTFADYEAKAGATAGAALSAVQTARLVVDGSRHDRMLGPYTSRVLAESEGAAAGAQLDRAAGVPPSRGGHPI